MLVLSLRRLQTRLVVPVIQMGQTSLVRKILLFVGRRRKVVRGKVIGGRSLLGMRVGKPCGPRIMALSGTGDRVISVT